MRTFVLVLVATLCGLGCRSSTPAAAGPERAPLGCRVEGCVREPGVQDLAGLLTVREAIQAAGPIEGRSDLAHVQLLRGDGDERILILVDVRAMLESGDSSSNVLLQHGDVLRVPELPDLPEPGGDGPGDVPAAPPRP